MSYDWFDTLSDIQISRYTCFNGDIIYSLVSDKKNFTMEVNLSKKDVFSIWCSSKPLKCFLEENKNVILGFVLMFHIGYFSIINDVMLSANKSKIQ